MSLSWRSGGASSRAGRGWFNARPAATGEQGSIIVEFELPRSPTGIKLEFDDDVLGVVRGGASGDRARSAAQCRRQEGQQQGQRT